MKKVLLLTCTFFTLVFSSCNKDNYSDLTTPAVEDEVIRIDFSEAEATPDFFNKIGSVSTEEFEVLDVQPIRLKGLLVDRSRVDFDEIILDYSYWVKIRLSDGRISEANILSMKNGMHTSYFKVGDEKIYEIDNEISTHDTRTLLVSSNSFVLPTKNTDLVLRKDRKSEEERKKEEREKACSNATRVMAGGTIVGTIAAGGALVGGAVLCPPCAIIAAGVVITSGVGVIVNC